MKLTVLGTYNGKIAYLRIVYGEKEFLSIEMEFEI
jgi:hypothetical protein